MSMYPLYSEVAGVKLIFVNELGLVYICFSPSKMDSLFASFPNVRLLRTLGCRPHQLFVVVRGPAKMTIQTS